MRAERAMEKGVYTGTDSSGSSSADVQENIDEMRAEIAQLRSELKNHQN
jgi:hypothetical protein